MFDPASSVGVNNNQSSSTEFTTIEQNKPPGVFLDGLEPLTAHFTSSYRFEEETDDDDSDETHNLDDSNTIDMFHLSPLLRHDRTNYTINKPTNWPDDIANEPYKNKTLKEKLLDMFMNEAKQNLDNKFNYSTNLLEKLLRRDDDYNTVVLNLYPLEKGFTLSFNIKKWVNGGVGSLEVAQELNSTETSPVSYEENELLYYVNAGEIPPIVIDLIDHINVQLFYDGCVILEIRDHRRQRRRQQADSSSNNNNSTTASFETRFVLLQPSMQTLVADLNSITNDSHFIWTQEDKYSLESQLLLATTQPLWLTPDPRVLMLRSQAVVQSSNRSSPIRFDRRLKRFSQRYTESYRLKSKRWSQYSLPYPFRLLKTTTGRTNGGAGHTRGNKWTDDDDQLTSLLVDNKPLASWSERESHRLLNEKFNSLHCIDSWSNGVGSSTLGEIKLPREDLLMIKRLSSFNSERMKFSNDQNLYPIEEIVLEAADKSSKNNYSKLLIKRRAVDGVYFCQLSLRPSNNNNHAARATTNTSDNNSDVVFQLGLISDAEKYVQQYVKIFTEEGHRSVNIMHNVLDKTVKNNNNKPPGSGSSQVASIYSTIRKPNDMSLVSHGVMFQSLFSKPSSQEQHNNQQQQLTDKQVLMYQAFLQNEHQQKMLKQQQQHQAMLSEAAQNAANNLESSNSAVTTPTSSTTPVYSPSTTNFRSSNLSSPSIASTQMTQSPQQQFNTNHSPLNRPYVNIQPARPVSGGGASLQESPIKPNGAADVMIVGQNLTRGLSQNQQHGKSPNTTTVQKVSHSECQQSSPNGVVGNHNSSLIQIYVPKLVNTDSNGNSPNVALVQSSQAVVAATTASSQQPKARKTSTPRAKNTKATSETAGGGDNETTATKPKRQTKKKSASTAATTTELKQQSPSVMTNGINSINGLNHSQIAPRVAVNDPSLKAQIIQHQQHSSNIMMQQQAPAGTKIINASSLLRKLATNVDHGTSSSSSSNSQHRSLPLIVTLNSGANSTDNNTTPVTYYNHNMTTDNGKQHIHHHHQQQDIYTNGATSKATIFQHSVSPMKQIAHHNHEQPVSILHTPNGLVKQPHQQQSVNNSFGLIGQQQHKINNVSYNNNNYAYAQPQQPQQHQQQQSHQSLIIVKPVNSNGFNGNHNNHPNSNTNTVNGNNNNNLNHHHQIHFHGQLSAHNSGGK